MRLETLSLPMGAMSLMWWQHGKTTEVCMSIMPDMIFHQGVRSGMIFWIFQTI